MSKLYRSLLWSGIVTFGIAACGDDVTVTQPPPPPTVVPGIRSVTVAPDGVSIQVGATVQMTAAVTTDPGAAAPTIAWSSSDATKATVGATTGLVTGVAVGAVGIRATATSGTSTGSGVATVNVVTSQVTPATVSIASITNTAGVAVPLGNVAGQIQVNVNLERGGERVQRLELLVDGVVRGSQTFASALAEGSAPEAAIEVISLPWNTAAFNASTGAADVLNGNRTVAVRLITQQNQQGTATPSVQITLNNANFVAVTLTISNGTTATDATGLLWQTGDATATALPVFYSAGTNTINQVVFSAPGVNSKTVTAAPWTTSWAKATTVGNGGSAGVENAAWAVTANSTVNNNPGPNGTSASIRYDNAPPTVPTFFANPNNRQGGWVNDAVAFTTLQSATNLNGMRGSTSVDGGVGGITYAAKAAPGNSAAALASPDITGPSGLARSLANAYCLMLFAQDALGNRNSAGTVSSTACTSTGVNVTTIGVDRDAPTIAFSGGLASNARLNGGTIGAEFQVTVSDTGTVGNSGMNSASSVVGTVLRRNAAASATCVVGVVVNSVCTATSVNAAPPFPLVPTTAIAAQNTTGYYSYSAVAQDAAGNQSGSVSRVIAYDPAANVPALTTALFNTPLTGPTAVFNANASDNFDLWTAVYTLTYGGGLPGPVLLPTVTLNTFNVAPLVNSNVAAGITVDGFMRQVEAVTGNAPLATGGTFKPTQLDGVARDQANNPSATATTPIPGASVTTGVSYTAAAAPQLVDSWAITAPSAATSISNGAGPAAAVNPLSVTITADVFGPTLTFNPPFARVDFYRVVGGQLVLIGTATTPTTTDNGAANGRRHRYSISWTPGATVATGVQTIHAIGVNSVGDALVSAANGNITITNP